MPKSEYLFHTSMVLCVLVFHTDNDNLLFIKKSKKDKIKKDYAGEIILFFWIWYSINQYGYR